MRLLNRPLAFILAAALAVASIIVMIEVTAFHFNSGPLLLHWTTWYHWAGKTHWDQLVVQVWSAILIVVGALILAIELKPRRVTRLRLRAAGPEQVQQGCARLEQCHVHPHHPRRRHRGRVHVQEPARVLDGLLRADDEAAGGVEGGVRPDEPENRAIRGEVRVAARQRHQRRRGARRDQRRLLRPTSRSADDRGLRGAAPGRHRTEQRAAEIGRPGGDQLAVVLDDREWMDEPRCEDRDTAVEAHADDLPSVRVCKVLPPLRDVQGAAPVCDAVRRRMRLEVRKRRRDAGARRGAAGRSRVRPARSRSQPRPLRPRAQRGAAA